MKENAENRPNSPPSIEVRSPCLPGVEIRTGRNVTAPYPKHWHDEIQLCAVTGGGGYLEHRGTSWATPSSSLFLVAPGDVHANRTPEGCSFRSLYLGAAFADTAGFDPGGTKRRAFEARTGMIDDLRLVAAFLRLHRALETSLSPLRSESLLLSFLVPLAARHGGVPGRASRCGREARAVRRAREYLHAHAFEAVSLTALARLVALSPWHLDRVFSRAVGIPPHAYQVQLRVHRARCLILSGAPLADVALSTGFSDQPHLTRHFKRLTGVTPGRYARGRKNVQDRPLPLSQD